MQRSGIMLALSAPLAASAAESSPIGKVMEMLSGLQSKVIGEGEEAHRVFADFSEWCEEQSKTLSNQISTEKAEAADLKAVIDEESSRIGALSTKIEELSADISTDEADLKAATEIRDKEGAVFAAEEKDLSGIIDSLTRAMGIIKRDMQKSGGAALLQTQGAGNVVSALSAMVQASALSAADGARLTALVQSSNDDEDSGAPAGSVYTSQSGGILGVLQGLTDQAQTQLDDARKQESKNINDFEMMKLSLEDQLKFGNAELKKAHKGLAASGERKATAEGDLQVTTKDLNSDTSTLADLHHNCMAKASDYEAETKSRDEELNALAEAKKIIAQTTGGANELSYSLLQVSGGTDLQVVRFVRELARKQKSAALTQLAARIASVVSSRDGSDPFAKIKGLIRDMITKLEAEAEADATHEAYCDKEIAESNVKHQDKTDEIAKLTTQMDSMEARSRTLKEEVVGLQQALANIKKSQSEMDTIREKEHAEFLSNKADMEKGLDGVKLALKVLTEYYAQDDKAHVAAEGAGGGIIGLLEVVESDFTKGLAQMKSDEESALAAYDSETKRNEIDTANKNQDVKYKSKEASDLDKATAEATSDRATVQTELDAVGDYLARLHKECDEKVEPYAETKRRREAELAGLQEALEILGGEAVLFQRASSRHERVPVRSHRSASA